MTTLDPRPRTCLEAGAGTPAAMGCGPASPTRLLAVAAVVLLVGGCGDDSRTRSSRNGGNGPSHDLDHDGDGVGETLDCDDASPYVYPGADEICGDSIDQDCSGEVDDGSTDADGDGSVSDACTGGTDCDDTQPGVGPLANEVPYDGIDQDCDGADLTDVDGDGYDGEEAGGLDCDDDDRRTHPGAAADCESHEDNDCDGDEWYYDDDCCDLSCYCVGTELSDVFVTLSCAEGTASVSYHYYSNGAVKSSDVEYSNGTSYSCTYVWNGFGQLSSFQCTTDFGGGDLCGDTCT